VKNYLQTKHASLAVVVLVMLGAGVLRAATLDDYDARLTRVLTSLAVFEGASSHEQHSGMSRATYPDLEFVRQDLPAKEKISFRGQTIDVDNSWLDDDLDDYKKSTKASDRSAAIARLTEHLKAIQQSVRDLHDASSPVGDKDADKGRLAAILRRPEYVPSAPQGNALQQLLDRFLRWLENLLPKQKPMQPGHSLWISRTAQVLIIAACVGIIGLLIWRYWPALVGGRRKKKKKREARIVLGERLEPDQTSADLLAQAEDLARAGNLRAAIRKAYIALLCELGDRKIISLAQYKTNRDYLNAVRDKGSLYPSMRRLTNMFELHWYGFVPAVEGDWDEFRNAYRKIFRGEQ
jgi:hypothetical protein